MIGAPTGSVDLVLCAVEEEGQEARLKGYEATRSKDEGQAFGGKSKACTGEGSSSRAVPALRSQLAHA